MKCECFFMNFVTRLPKCKVYNAVFMVINVLTKVTHLVPVKKEHNSKDISFIFMRSLLVYRGLPIQVFDCDSNFISNFSKAIFEATSMTLAYSTIYHPYINGKTKRPKSKLGH